MNCERDPESRAEFVPSLGPSLGPSATVARLGGDEFAILVPEVESRDDSRTAAERVLAAFKEPFNLGRRTIYVSPSVGIAHSPTECGPNRCIQLPGRR